VGHDVTSLRLAAIRGRYRCPGDVCSAKASCMTATNADATIVVPANHLMAQLLGQRDEHLRLIEAAYPAAQIRVRGNEIAIAGADSAKLGTLFEELIVLVQRGHVLEEAYLKRVLDMVSADEQPSKVLTDEVLKGAKGRSVRPKTAGQKRYIDAIRANVITFGVGPAGTGKSWLAVAMAVKALQAKEVQRIILTRPAVEAGERLGFLPGDLMAKIDPYLRPLYDALYDMVEPEGVQKLLERNALEIAPLAFMRGRTLNNSFIILDEAQNTTPEQMKMFLTRIGFGSKVVVTGDSTQIDVPGGRSGLAGLQHLLAGIDGLDFVLFDRKDVVRHRIVADIVAAYERLDEFTAQQAQSSPNGQAANTANGMYRRG
jgi:phosphate starvation-inducible protein PhoH and related proteins